MTRPRTRHRFLWLGLLTGWLAACGQPSARPDPVVAAPVEPAPVEPAPVEPAAPEVPEVTDPERALDLASFDYVWQTIKDRHYDPELGGLDWDAVRAELRPKVVAAADRAAARAAMEEMLARLGQSHFVIFPGEAYSSLDPEAAADGAAPAGEAGEGAAASEGEAPGEDAPAAAPARPLGPDGDTHVGIEIAVIDGAVLVADAPPDMPAHRAGVRSGWRVVRVDGVELSPIVAEVTEALAESGVAEAMLWRGLDRRLRGPQGSVAVLDLEDGKGRAVTRRVTRANPPGRAVVLGNLPPIWLRYHSRRIGKDIGYITFSAFLDPPTIMGSFVKDVRAFADTRGIIIDLRGNPGGLGGMAMGMGGWFVTEPQSLGTMITRETRLEFVLNPQAAPYGGPVAILIDAGSMSTSEIFAAGLRDIGRARVFGTPSPGAALPSVIERLPNGDGFQYAFANYVSASGQVLEGHGVEPDELVARDRRALLAGRDPVIDAAVAWIRKAPKATKAR
jgi:carboxyl-terminal processing protease